MKSFQELFMESDGAPISYNGKTVYIFDKFHINSKEQLHIEFESVNSSWRQGIGLDTDGYFYVNNQKIRKSIVLWEDTAPPEVRLTVNSKSNLCYVRNLWDTGNGAMQCWQNGAGMLIQELVNGRRYLCNDGYPDDDFDDLIFSIRMK